MKKFLSVVLVALILVLSFTFSVSADSAYTFSEDYKTLYLNGNIYHSFSGNIYSELFYYENTPKLTKEQEEELTSVTIELDADQMVAMADLRYTDGAMMTVWYLRGDAYADYKAALEGKVENYTVRFGFIDPIEVEMSVDQLSSGKLPFTIEKLYEFYTEEVNVFVAEGNVGVNVGKLIYGNDEFYFLNYAEEGIIDTSNVPETFSVHPIEDTKLKEKLIEAAAYAETEGFGSYVGLVGVDELITAIIILIIFAMIPTAMLIFGFIMIFVSKKSTYKKLYLKLTLVSGLELAIFTVVAAILLIAKYL